MKTWAFLTILALLVCGTHGQVDTTDVVKANNKFAFQMHKQIVSDSSDKNSIIAPFSISVALGMTYLGTAGTTYTEMREKLGYEGINGGDVHNMMKILLDIVFQDSDDYTLDYANKLYPSDKYTFLLEFLDQTQLYYKAALEELDFVNHAEDSRKKINKWVEEQTDEKIKELLKPGIIDSTTVLVIVNAIYFKGFWEQPFNSTLTTPASFTTPDGSKIVGMMTMKSEFKMATRSQYSMLELDYKGDRLSMILILPKSGVELTTVEDALTAEEVSNALASLASQNVDLHMPKFRLEHGQSLQKLLEDLGIKKLFLSGTADLSKMDGTNNLFVSDVVHKAYIDVNEEGKRRQELQLLSSPKAV